MSSFIDYDISDATLHMPNGMTLYVTEGSIPVIYNCHRGDRDIGEPDRYAEWDVYCQTIPLTAIDEDERVIRLELPVRHPAIRDLLNRYDDSIHDECMDNGEY